jgi:Domain of unknown function (DUF1918)
MSKQPLSAEIGDQIVVEGHRVGAGGRRGEILQVLGTPDHPHYRVRWDDDRETLLYPSSDALVVHGDHPRRKRKEPARQPAA